MIGVYGGTFNPVHFGHLRTALDVRDIFALEEIRLIPCHLPPHREEPEVAAAMRLQMLQLAIADVPGLCVDRRELDRPGPSYMVDTLRSLREEGIQVQILLFIGTDAFAKLETWHQWRRLFDYAHLVVMTRPGYHPESQKGFFKDRVLDHREQLDQFQTGRIYFQDVTQLDISASTIRDLIAEGRDPRFLLPDSVITYIKTHRLYTEKTR